MATPPRASTHASRERQKPPVAYSGTLRRISSRVNQLTDELALECTTNVEFEEASRRSFEFLNKEVRALKEALNTLTDSILEEVDRLNTAMRCDLCRLDERQKHLEKSVHRDIHEVLMKQLERQQERQQELSKEQERQQDRQRDLEERTGALAKAQQEQRAWQQELEGRSERLAGAEDERRQQLEKRLDTMAQDFETMISVIPGLEETMHRTHSLLQDRIGESALDISKINDAFSLERLKAAGMTERLEAKIQAVEGELRDDLEQRHLKLQRSITRQLESMSRVLIDSEQRPTPPALPGPRGSPAGSRRLVEPERSASASLLQGPPSRRGSPSRHLDLDLSSFGPAPTRSAVGDTFGGSFAGASRLL